MNGDFISNHEQLAQNRLIEQYKNRPNILALTKGLISPLQEIENQLERLDKDRSLNTAIGAQLDYLGDIVGEERNFKNDEEYRRALYTRIMINNGGGCPEDIITAINLTYKPHLINYSEYHGSFHLYVQGNHYLSGLKSAVRSISPAGVGDFVITYFKGDNPFMFSECSIEEADLLIADNEGKYFLSIQDKQGLSTTLGVAADTFLAPAEGLGFGEIVITKSRLDSGDGSIYMVDDNTPLVLITSLADFKIVGGGAFAEVIENG